MNRRANHFCQVTGRILLLLLLAPAGGAASSATIEEETLTRLNAIRAIKAGGGSDATERYNKQLDEAWKFFNANKPKVLPILRKELSGELQKERPNQMLLLDAGYFVRLQKDPSDKELGRRAFFAIDSEAEIVRWNGEELFHYAHAVVPDRDPRTLAILEKAFLRGKVTAFIPQHALSLDETLVCVFLYGVYGQGAESHLKSLLADRSIARRVIEILVWVGSPDSIPEVKAAMMAGPDYETFIRGTAFMMTAGGPKGRATMLALEPKDFDAKSQEYYAKVRKGIESTSYDEFRKQFSRFPGEGKVSDAELKSRLSAMYASYGRDDKTSPMAFLNSGLPPGYLIGELSRIRGRMFYRVSDEALSDVKITNALINALRYK